MLNLCKIIKYIHDYFLLIYYKKYPNQEEKNCFLYNTILLVECSAIVSTSAGPLTKKN